MEKTIYFGGSTRPDRKPKPMPDYIDLDKIDPIEFDQIFKLWVGIVWAHERDVPVEPEALGRFSEKNLIPEFRKYVQANGLRALDRGLSVEETWVMMQISTRRPYICLLNAAQPRQPLGCVTRKAMFPSAELIALLQQAYDQWDSDTFYPTMVFDGQMGHCILLMGIDEATGAFRYRDPWPGRSLLCEEENAAGVKAMPTSGRSQWLITPDDLRRVVFAVLIPLDEWNDFFGKNQ
jgi:hypothetical protein